MEQQVKPLYKGDDNKITLTSGDRVFIKSEKWVSLLSIGDGYHIAASAEEICPAQIYLVSEKDREE